MTFDPTPTPGHGPRENRGDAAPNIGGKLVFSSGAVNATLDRLGNLPFVQIAVATSRSGDPRAPFSVGEAQGELLQDQIHDVWRFYRHSRFKSFTDEQLKTQAAHFEKVIETFEPAYAEEIRGIACGAGLEPWQVFALNARTELINRARQSSTPANEPGECTSVSFGGGAAVMGQTWDWGVDVAQSMAAIEITRPDGHTLVFLAEPGIIGKMGMNSAGVGVALNILGGEAQSDGVPIHILLRSALDADSAEAAIARFQFGTARGTMSNILIADATGKHALLEFYGHDLFVISPTTDICHTNHYLESGVEVLGDDFSSVNSACRLQRTRQLLHGVSNRSVDDMKAILGDQANGEHAISATPKYYADYDMTIGTIVTMVADLKNRTIHFTHSKDGHAAYTAHTIRPANGHQTGAIH
jgi:isopenicillin-N N-acyltransferase-like protein